MILRKFLTLFSPAAVTVPALAVAHDMTVAKIGGIGIKTNADLAYVHREMPYISGTFIPSAGREPILESLRRLSDRVSQAKHLKTTDREAVLQTIQAAVTKIGEQPEKMAPAGNGVHDEHTGAMRTEHQQQPAPRTDA